MLLHQFGSETGFMILPRKLELLAGADSLAIAARHALAYRTSLGTNWYMNGHRLKVGVMHRQSFNVLGVRHPRAHATYVQAQLAF
jgi:phosphate-selective porin OprO and OprP